MTAQKGLLYPTHERTLAYGLSEGKPDTEGVMTIAIWPLHRLTPVCPIESITAIIMLVCRLYGFRSAIQSGGASVSCGG